jgi:ribosomal protein S17E
MLPESTSIKTKLMEFINVVRQNPDSKTLKQVKDFVTNLSNEHQNIFREDLQNYENNIEAIENIISKALYDELAGLASQKLVDEKVTLQMKKYNRIKPEHLEIDDKVTTSNTYSRAIQDLQKVNQFKSPKDKLTLIVNACKLVNGIVWDISKNKDIPSGADDFLPV